MTFGIWQPRFVNKSLTSGVPLLQLWFICKLCSWSYKRMKVPSFHPHTPPSLLFGHVKTTKPHQCTASSWSPLRWWALSCNAFTPGCRRYYRSIGILSSYICEEVADFYVAIESKRRTAVFLTNCASIRCIYEAGLHLQRHVSFLCCVPSTTLALWKLTMKYFFL